MDMNESDPGWIAPTYRIEWEGEPRPDLEQQLRTEISWFSDDDDVPASLVFHTMMVGDADIGSDGPSVIAHWDTERECVVAEYTERTRWVTLAEMEDD